MRVVVDLNRCQGYAQCCYAAPEHFAMRGREILFYDPAPPEARRAEIERARQACPVRAISVEPADVEFGDDPGDADPGDAQPAGARPVRNGAAAGPEGGAR